MADYAISNVPRRVVYAASGVGPYAFTFEILDQTDISVYKGSTLLTLTTDYTVTINANGTGSVTLVTTAGTSNITIVGAKNIQRTTDFTTGGDLFANSLNDELDNQTIFIQQVAETAERGLKAPVTDPTDIAMTLPDKAGRKGKVLAFDSTTGNPVAGPALDSVTTVIEQSNNINTVATNIASVNTVATNISNVNTVAGISGNVTTVAGSISNVNTVADDLNEPVSEIHTVGTNIANVNAVGTNIANVNSVAGNATNINAVAGNSTNINAVAGNATNINTVAGNNTNINTVAGISANVTSVAGNASNINQVASDTVAINAASANAATATTKAAEALASANSASASAAAASAVALGNEPVRHSVRPSLLLDFANTKTLDPRITFTRGSTGTFYDGKTVAKAEENLYTYSQDFDNADWTKVFVTTTTNSTTAPDGTATAETIVEDTANNVHRLNKAAPIIASTPYVFSIYVKDVNRQFITLSVTGASSNYFGATYDLTNVTVPSNRQVGTGYVYTSASITAVGNGWYRLVLIGTVGTAVSSIAQCIGLSTTGTPTVDGRGTESYTGTGASLYLWGAQLEQRSSVTAYTPTTTAPITNYIPALQTAAANVARFEHNPVTGESLGLEIEEQRTNLLTYSSDFSNAAWSKVGTLTANDTIAPDGTLSAERLSTGTANLIGLPSFIPVTSGIAYTGSVWLKSAVLGQPATLRLNLSKGVATPEASLSITTTDQWVRYTVTLTTTSTGLFFQIGEWGTLGYGPTKDVHVWGAQLEAGSFATSYIPTVASQVTRSADSAVMTGTNFSSWYRGDAGTIYAETQASAITSGYQYAITSGNSTASGAGLFYDSASSRFSYRFWDAGGTAIGVISYTNAGSPNATTSYKTTFAFSTNDFAGSINGNVVTTDTSGVINGIADNLKIGASNNNTSLMNGTIKKLAYYPKRLTNAELVAMTTI